MFCDICLYVTYLTCLSFLADRTNGRAYATGGTAAAAPPPSGLATLPSVGAVP